MQGQVRSATPWPMNCPLILLLKDLWSGSAGICLIVQLEENRQPNHYLDIFLLLFPIVKTS